MLRAVVLIVVFVLLLSGAAMSDDLRAVMALAGIAANCAALDWLTKPHA